MFMACEKSEGKKKMPQMLSRALDEQKDTLDPGIVITVKNGKVTAEKVTLSRHCLNPVTPDISKLPDTMIIMNLKTGEATGY